MDGDEGVQREVYDPVEGVGRVIRGSVQGALQAEQGNGGNKKIQIIGESWIAD